MAGKTLRESVRHDGRALKVGGRARKLVPRGRVKGKRLKVGTY
jgi:hypothetical protein